MSANQSCPCHSGLRPAQCCAPLHAGEREAATPEALMRSRYAAFALGRGEYLVRTLASTHPDLRLPHDELVRQLGKLRERRRFMGLRIVHAGATETDGEVLFLASVFERGQDLSFAELSRFVREDGAWRYADGRLLPVAKLPQPTAALTRDAFLALL